MLQEEDLSPADEDLLDLLREGRITAPYAASEIDYSLQYIRDRLGRLVEHGNAKKIYDGLYELVEDPRHQSRSQSEKEGGKEPENRTQTPGVAPEEPEGITPEPPTEGDADLLGDYRDYMEDRSPQKSHAKDLVVDTLRLLRQEGSMSTGELQSELFEEYNDHYSTERTMWNAVSRYFKELPGFEKGDYGEWDYAGDAPVREEIRGKYGR